MTYNQTIFERELEKMLAEAEAKGKASLRVIAKDLHGRVVHGKANCMPTVCNAMWYVWREQGWHRDRCIFVPRSGQSTTLEIEFATN